MAKVTMFFAILLVALGLYGFLSTGKAFPSALIPAGIGFVLGVCGFLAISPDEHRRKHFMHINATVALVGFLGTFIDIVRSCASSQPLNMTVVLLKLAAVWLLFIYVVLCVRSFITARRSGKV